MEHDVDFKLPRLYVDQPFVAGETLILADRAHHYLKNVMRRQTGDFIRLFNGSDGEFLGTIGEVGKKNLQIKLQRQTRAQPAATRAVHLVFAPIKKARQDLMVEKAVELGVDIFHPILTDHGDVRDLNAERMGLQMIEAAEQSERLTIPRVMPIKPLREVLHNWPKDLTIIAGVERVDAPPLYAHSAMIKDAPSIAALIGPVGGWSEAEKNWLMQSPVVTGVNLGDEILRSETAAIATLSYIKFVRNLKEMMP